MKKIGVHTIGGRVFWSSLPSFLIAEIFFSGVYFFTGQIIQTIYLLLSMSSTAQIEANMSIFSPINITIFAISVAIMAIILFLELATIIAITAYDYYRDDHIPFRQLLQFSFGRLKSIIHLKAAPFFLFIFFFPKEFIGPKGLFSLHIPPFIVDELIKSPLYQIIIFLITICILYGLYRSIFVIHYIILDSRGILESFRLSAHLTKKIGYKKMIINIIRSAIIIVIFTLPIVAFLVALSRYIGQYGENISQYFILISSFLISLAEFLSIGLPGVIFLSGMTVLFLQTSQFSNYHFARRFQFIKNRPDFTPRWYNLRRIFSKKYIFFTGIIAIILMPLFLMVIFPKNITKLTMPKIISHRGEISSSVSENSINAILNAKKNGADMVEIDVYQNKSGTLILSHDDNLKRVANFPFFIKNLTDAEIKQITLKTGEKIPTLDEILKIAKTENIQLLIEPKIHGQEKNMPEKLIQLIEKHSMQDQVFIHSLNLNSAIEIKKLNPHIPVGYIVFGGFGKFGHLGVDFFSLQETIATKSQIDDIHFYDKKAFVWTINNTESVNTFIKMGIDGIITDTVASIKNEATQIVKSPSHSLGNFQILIWKFSDRDIGNGWNYTKNFTKKIKNFIQ